MSGHSFRKEIFYSFHSHYSFLNYWLYNSLANSSLVRDFSLLLGFISVIGWANLFYICSYDPYNNHLLSSYWKKRSCRILCNSHILWNLWWRDFNPLNPTGSKIYCFFFSSLSWAILVEWLYKRTQILHEYSSTYSSGLPLGRSFIFISWFLGSTPIW